MRRGGSVATGAIPSGSNPCARDGFGAAVRGAVEDGVSATLACLGIHGCGKSSLVRGGSVSGSGSSFANGGALDQMGVCGRIAADVFAAIGDVCERENDEFIVSLQAIADVITAPVDASAINPNKRKTHEVLKDALATGLDLVGLERGGVFDPERVELRGGRGEGARSVRSAFHGAGESAPTRIDVREHPTRGFFAEGAIEVVATDADELQRLVAAALAGFKHEEAQCGGSGRSGSGSGSGERVHCLLQVNVRRRTREGECDDEGIFLPHRETGAFSFTLVPIRPRWRGERRSLRTFAVVSLRPGSLAFDPLPRRLSTPLLTPFNSTPTFARMERPTVARVQIVDFAGVDRSGGGGGAAGGKKGSGGGGAAEDAALKALTRVVDSLHDARSHVPHRDSKLTVRSPPRFPPRHLIFLTRHRIFLPRLHVGSHADQSITSTWFHSV